MSLATSWLATLKDAWNSLFGRNTLSNFTAQTPEITPERHLNGEFIATGMIQDRQGKILSRFDITMTFTWRGTEATLNESYQFHGQTEIQHKSWTITKLSEQHYQGLANDLVGVAQGRCSGNALNWRYHMRIPVNGKSMTFAVDDWMWLHNENTIINRSRLKKFGMTVAELTVFMHRKVSHE